VQARNAARGGARIRRPACSTIVVTAEAQSPVASDLDLLRATAAGDSDAFEELVRRHQDRLLTVCQRLLGDREEARDAAQEVFLKAYRKAGRFRPDAKVSTWLYRIAVNHCLNRLRRRKVVWFFSLGGGERSGGDRGGRRAGPTGSIGPVGPRGAFDPVDPAPPPDAVLDSRRRWALTRRALGKLPESQRAVVVLVRFEGLSYDEVAEVLGTTTSAVASRLFRAMRQLEKAVEAEGGGAAAGRGRSAGGHGHGSGGATGGGPRGSDGSRVS